jgi:hypothetical protein
VEFASSELLARISFAAIRSDALGDRNLAALHDFAIVRGKNVHYAAPFPNIDEGCSFYQDASGASEALADEAAIALSGAEAPTKSQQRNRRQR